MKRIIAIGVFVLLATATSHAQLKGTFPTGGGYLTLSKIDTPAAVSTLELTPSQAGLTLGQTSAPFQSSVAFPSGRVEFYAGTTDVVIDGDVTLDLQVPADGQIMGRHGVSGSAEVIEFPITAGETTAFPLSAIRPYAGGPITVALSLIHI